MPDADMIDRAAARAANAARAEQIAHEAAEHFSKEGAGLYMPTSITRPPISPNDSFQHWNEEKAWPKVAPLLKPLGSRVLVQFRQPIAFAASGKIFIPHDSRETDRDNETVAKVIALGALAFRNRETQALWPEGAWCKEGDYIRVPKYQLDMFRRKFMRRDITENADGTETVNGVADEVRFAQVKDLDVLGIYDSLDAALAERAFI